MSTAPIQFTQGRYQPRAGLPTVRAVDMLSPRECEVARLVSVGLTNKDIAATLYLSCETVKSHLRRISRTLGVTGRVNVAAAIGFTGDDRQALLPLRRRLTKREMQVLTLVADGKTNQQIASTLRLSVPTVKTHLTRINVAMRSQASTRITLVRLAIRYGLLTLGSEPLPQRPLASNEIRAFRLGSMTMSAMDIRLALEMTSPCARLVGIHATTVCTPAARLDLEGRTVWLTADCTSNHALFVIEGSQTEAMVQIAVEALRRGVIR